MKTLKFFYLLLIAHLLQASLQAQQLIPYRKGKKWGFSDKSKNIVIPCKYDNARFFLDDIAKVQKNRKWGLIQKDGSIFLPFEYDIVYAASSKGRVIVCKNGDRHGHNGRWGFVPIYKGEEIPLDYDLIRECGTKNLLGVLKNGRWGAINQFGKVVIPIQYEVENIESHNFQNEHKIIFQDKTKSSNSYLKLRFKNKLARVKRGDKWGFVNAYSTEVIPCKYDFVGEFAEGLVCVVKKINNVLKLGFVNQRGETVIPIEYEIAESYRSLKFSKGLVAVKKGGKIGYINKQNQTVIPFEYSQAYAFESGLAIVSKSVSQFRAEYLVINTKNKLIRQLPKDYKLVDKTFSDGFLRLVKNDKTLLINSQGEIISKNTYKDIHTFKLPSFYAKQKLAKVTQYIQGKLKMGFIDEKSREVIPLVYDFDKNSRFIGGFCKVRKNDKWGIINKRGKVLIDFRFDAINLPFFDDETSFFTEGLLAVNFAGKWGFINASERVFIPFKYEEVRNFILGYAQVKYSGQWGYINKRGEEYWE